MNNDKPFIPKKLFNKNFILLSQGHLTSTISAEVFTIAMILFVKSITDSGTTMGFLFAMSSIPGILFGPFAGTIADRYPRKWIMVICDFANSLLVGVLTLCAFTILDRLDILIPVMTVVVLMMGTTNTFFRPSMDASIPDIVPRNSLEKANSISVFSNHTSLFVGQSMGSVIFAFLGAPITFLINSITFFISSITETFIHIPKKIKKEKESWIKSKFHQFIKETKDGFHYLFKVKGVRNYAVVNALFVFLTTPFMIILPFFVEDHLNLDYEWVGFLIASLAIGGIGGVAIPSFLRVKKQYRFMVVGLAYFTASLLIGSLYFVRSLCLIIPGFVLVGVCLSSTTVYLKTVIHLNTETDIRGRVTSLVNTINQGLKPVGLALIGVIIDLLDKNIPIIFLIVGGIALSLSILLVSNSSFRMIMKYKLEKEIDG